MNETESQATTLGEELMMGYPGMADNSKEDFEMTHDELNQIKDAMKEPKFRQLLNDYVTEVRDPANQLTYQTEMRQLERERGNIIHFINPQPGYVLKTSVDGKQKAFINICSNPLVKKPSFETVTQDNKTGSLWSIPYCQSPGGREDMDKARNCCTVYDVIFNPEALKMGKQNKVLQQKLEETALDAVEKSFNVVLDKNNIRKPKLRYKGLKVAAIIKYKVGASPPDSIDPNELGKELPPLADEVQNYKSKDNAANTKSPKEKEKTNNNKNAKNLNGSGDGFPDKAKPKSDTPDKNANRPKSNKNIESEHTVPIYSLKYRSYVDMQDYTIDGQRDGRNSKPIPDEIILTVDLPLLRNSSTLNADVIEDGWEFELISDKTAQYKLKLKLPFQVHQDASKAVFDKDKRKLCITMKTIKKTFAIPEPLPSHPQPREQILEEIPELKHSHDTDNSTSPDSLSPSLDRMSSMSLTDSPSPPSEALLLQELSSSVGSPNSKKSVHFSDVVQRQLYRSNSSILGQRKKNQRKAKNKKRSRERLNSGESISSMDDEDGSGAGIRTARERICSGESVSSLDEDLLDVLGNCSGEEDDEGQEQGNV